MVELLRASQSRQAPFDRRNHVRVLKRDSVPMGGSAGLRAQFRLKDTLEALRPPIPCLLCPAFLLPLGHAAANLVPGPQSYCWKLHRGSNGTCIRRLCGLLAAAMQTGGPPHTLCDGSRNICFEKGRPPVLRPGKLGAGQWGTVVVSPWIRYPGRGELEGTLPPHDTT